MKRGFWGRLLAFFLGMIFMLIVLVGGIAGAGYWAYKNITLEKVGVSKEDIGEISGWTVEKWTSYIMEATNNPQKFTISQLEQEGFKSDLIFDLLKIDTANANPSDLQALKDLAVLSLVGGNVTDIDLGLLFLFLPKNAEGKYPIFSEGAREHLRQYKLSDLLAVDENGTPGYMTILSPLKVGSVLTSLFDEEKIEDSYSYSAKDMGINLLANVEFSVLTDNLKEGAKFDIGYELKEGHLVDLGDKEIREIVASFGSTDEEAYNTKYNDLAILGNSSLNSLIVKDVVTNEYQFDLNILLNDATIGGLLGYTICSQDENCAVHSDISACDGELYKDGAIYEADGLMYDINKNLTNLSIGSLIGGGFDFTSIVDGITLASVMNYKKGVDTALDSEYCLPDCNLDEEDETHKHNFYFVDGSDVFVGPMLNELANLSFEDLINGEANLNSIIDDLTIGKAMGYTEVDGVWFDKNGSLVSQETLMEKVIYKLLDKSINNIGDVSFEDLMSGVKIGDMLGYKQCSNSLECAIHENGVGCDGDWYEGPNKVGAFYNELSNVDIGTLATDSNAILNAFSNVTIGSSMGYEKGVDTASTGDYCLPECNLDESDDSHKHNFYYLDSNGNFVGSIINEIANIAFEDIIAGNVNISSIIDGLTIGDAMGYTLTDGKWYDKDGNLVKQDTLIEKIIYKLLDKSIENLNSITFEELTQDIKIGEMLGYKQCSNSLECAIHENGLGCDGSWYNGVDKVGLFYNQLSNIDLSALTSNQNAIIDAFSGITMGSSMDYTKGVDPASTGDYCLPNCNEDHKHKFYYLNVNGEFAGSIMNQIANISFADLINGSVALDTIVANLSIGDAMGYNLVGGKWFDKNGNLVKQDTLIEKIIYKLLDKNVENLNTITFGELMQGIKIGEMMGYKLCSKSASCVIHANGNGCDGSWYDGEDKADAFYNELANIEIESLTTDKNAITNALSNLSIGSIMGREKVGGSWKKVENGVVVSATSLENIMFDIKLGEILNGTLEFDGLLENVELSDIIEPGNNKILKYICNGTKLGNIGAKVEAMKIGDIVETSGNNFLSLIAGSSLNSLAGDINALKIGSIMGGTLCLNNSACKVHTNGAGCTGDWYKKQGPSYVLMSGTERKIANLTIAELSEGGFGNIEFTLGDVVPESELGGDSIFSIMDLDDNNDGVNDVEVKDVKIDEIADRILHGATNASISKLMDLSIITLSVDNQNKLTTLFGNTSWMNLSMTGFLNELLGRIPG